MRVAGSVRGGGTVESGQGYPLVVEVVFCVTAELHSIVVVRQGEWLCIT